jgi:hypothetical protein
LGELFNGRGPSGKNFFAKSHARGGGMMAKLSRKKQDELIQKEIDRLNAVFDELPDRDKEVARGLIERVAFMTIQLEILENEIKSKGPTYTFKNGKQKMLVENPAQKSYNTMMNRYTAAYKELFNLLKKIDNNSDENEFEDV